jgi:hypothetical protein
MASLVLFIVPKEFFMRYDIIFFPIGFSL